ncbi:MAG TPA: hypothetical protein VF756_02030 [Thermoanaerobaculia bacterium]
MRGGEAITRTPSAVSSEASQTDTARRAAVALQELVNGSQRAAVALQELFTGSQRAAVALWRQIVETLYRAGESFARRFQPTAIFHDRNLALLAAAVLPGPGRDRLLRLEGDPRPAGYPVVLDDGTPAGHLRLFDEPLLDALNVAVSLVRSPQSLAYLLEAAGGSPWSAVGRSWTAGLRGWLRSCLMNTETHRW